MLSALEILFIRRSFDEVFTLCCINPKERTYLLFNTKNNLAVKIENRLFEKIETDSKTRKQFYNFLYTRKFLPERNELEEAVQMFRDRDVSTLRIIILAHGDCNFRCKYCYEKFVDCTIESQKSVF